MEDFLWATLIGLIAAPITAWMAGALYFDVAQGKRIGWLLVAAWVFAVAATFYFSPRLWIGLLILLLVFAIFVRWWISLKPSQDRDWDPNFARLPQIEIAGDELTVQNVRNTEYRTIEDSDPRYETREYLLSQLHQVDVLVLYWGSELMSHPIFVFDFGEAGRLCISIEVRYRVGQKYSFWRRRCIFAYNKAV